MTPTTTSPTTTSPTSPATAARPASSIRDGAGQAVRHDSAVRHTTGEARFIDDLPEPAGLLHAWVLTSPHAHARVTGIDLTGVLAAPGVVAVITAADIPGVNDVAAAVGVEPLLAEGLVEYVGQPVLAVAARSRDEARAAALAAQVAYEPLEPVLTLDAAIARHSHIVPPLRLTRGDAAKAIARAQNVVTGDLRLGGQDHFYLETHIALALPGEDGDMRILSSTQHPSEVQHHVARLLGRPMSAVTVEVRRVGGGFGGKESQSAHFAGIAALLARASGRPVKLRPSRDDDMIITGKRHPFLLRWRVGFADDGRIGGLELTLAADCGWSADLSVAVLTRALCHADNAYYLPHVALTGLACKTNTCSHTAFRGFGAPQAMAAAEAVVEAVARHLGRDPLAVRRLNFYGGPGRTVTPYGQKVEAPLLDTVVGQLETRAEVARRRVEIAAFNAGHPYLRRGLALMPAKFGISFNLPALNQAGALVHVYGDGSIHLNHGGIEMGQGLYVKVAQVVAEEFQVDLDRVKITATATDKVPNTAATAASTGSDLNGKAAQAAARIIKERLAVVAARHFGVPRADVVFADNRVRAGNHVLEFAELAHRAWGERVPLSATGFYRTPKIHFDDATLTGRPFYYYVYGAAVAEVVVDTLTGESRVLRADILQDAGTSLNPAVDIGQIEGGFVQGLGWVTLEELVWDERGALRTHAPSTYKIPTSRDVPADFRVHLLEGHPNREDTIFRSKGIGEPPFLLALSVWLALGDAIASLADYKVAPRLDIPATPERVLAAIAGVRG